jgi:hypothetical protein
LCVSGESPFEVLLPSAAGGGAKPLWTRVNYTIRGDQAVLSLPSSSSATADSDAISGQQTETSSSVGVGGVASSSTGAAAGIAVRYAWEAWPQCSLYNGVGGPDNHTGIAATPFCWNKTMPCAY